MFSKLSMRRHFSSRFDGTFVNRAQGKSQLNEFFKFTHPDMFGKAPKSIKETNASSVQSLNQYL